MKTRAEAEKKTNLRFVNMKWLVVFNIITVFLQHSSVSKLKRDAIHTVPSMSVPLVSLFHQSSVSVCMGLRARER